MFSIVIPTKNERNYLPRLLKSISMQGLKPNKVIVADASTDNTRQIARDHGAIVTEGVSNGRIGIGRNNGARLVNDEFVVFLDADAYLPVNFFEDMFRHIHQNDLDVATPVLKSDIDKRRVKFFMEQTNLWRRVGMKMHYVFMETGACIIVRKAFFDKVGGFDTTLSLGEDTDFVRRIARLGANYSMVPVKIVLSGRRFDKSHLRLVIQYLTSFSLFMVLLVRLKLFDKSILKVIERFYGGTGGDAHR